jgi:hypothetical protein
MRLVFASAIWADAAITTSTNSSLYNMISDLPFYILSVYSARHRRVLYVAAFAFLAAVLAVIALIFTDKGSTALIIAALTGLVSSGATYFFGVWQPVTPRRSGSRRLQTPS